MASAELEGPDQISFVTPLYPEVALSKVPQKRTARSLADVRAQQVVDLG
ncbi:MAG TPA: hypothetical protein VF881_07325 [Polyangiaceae bacterium]